MLEIDVTIYIRHHLKAHIMLNLKSLMYKRMPFEKMLKSHYDMYSDER